jgi:rfaE bifunctional protein kinase chain/domain
VTARKQAVADDLIQALGRMVGRRLVVLGDLMLDEHIWGRVDRISPEAPVPVVQVKDRASTPGGAGNVAANVSALGGRAAMIALVGDDEAGREVTDDLKSLGVDVGGVIVDPSRPTIRKTRVIAHSQQVVRIDREEPREVGSHLAERLVAAVEDALAGADALLISDYDKGVITEATTPPLIASARAAGKLVTVDGKPRHFPLFRGAHLASPNLSEAATASGVYITDEATLAEAGEELLRRYDLDAVLITRGEHGVSLFAKGEPERHIPAVASEVYDVAGAGDTVIACATLAMAAGATLEAAARLANYAAAVVVKKVGVASASPDEVRELIS